MMTPDTIVAHARTYLRVPFRHQGRNRDGVDCVGLLVAIADDFGLHIEYSTNYDHRPDQQLFLEGVLKYCDEIPKDQRQPGDVLLFILRKGRWHVALQSTPDSMIHSSMTERRVVEHRMDQAWERQIKKVYRFRGAA